MSFGRVAQLVRALGSHPRGPGFEPLRAHPPMSNDYLHPTSEQAAAQRAAMHAARRQDVDLYIRTYNTLLRSSAQVKLKALVQAHFNMRSNLHPRASDPDLDVAALFYCSQRLPAEIARAKHIIMGQSTSVFEHHGIGDV